MNTEKQNEIPNVEIFKTMWYKRNPCHELNADSGEDMFWDTAELVAREYVSSLRQKTEPIKEEELIEKFKDYLIHNSDMVSREEYEHAINEIGQLQEQLKQAEEEIRDLNRHDFNDPKF